jgi:peptidoglycan L-alanyl-D-glutamate endopeptidase CwlK
MAKFSKFSKNNLKGADPRLQKLFNEVIKGYDCRVICSVRGKEEQNRLVKEGKSQLIFPKSKHNKTPSLAVDVIPYPVDWNDIDRFIHFGGYVQGVADTLGIKITWGGNWKSFKDYPHYQLK